jgi:hypothetical protein
MVVTLQALCSIEGKFVFKVVDEQGAPIKDAVIEMDTVDVVDAKDPSKGYKDIPVKGITDCNGCWSMEGKTHDKPAASAQKKGYYDSVVRFVFDNWKMKPWRWNPYEQKATIILRKINNPIPMYAWNMRRMDYPVGTNVWVGYDMLLAEWMPPHGKGEIEDVRFHVLRAADAYDRTQPAVVLTVLFTGEKNGVCGIDDLTISYQSWLKLPYSAPREGYSEKEFRFEKLLGEHEFKTMTNTGTTNCFFRVRSKTDKDGNFIEGLYGKIHGPVGVEGGKHIPICMIYYVNPTPNDLNMEFDPKRNLVPKKEAKNAVVRP